MKCPIHNETLERIEITQGENLLGYLYICPIGEWGSKHEKDECDYCIDADKEGNPIFEKWEQQEFLL